VSKDEKIDLVSLLSLVVVAVVVVGAVVSFGREIIGLTSFVAVAVAVVVEPNWLSIKSILVSLKKIVFDDENLIIEWLYFRTNTKITTIKAMVFMQTIFS